MQYNNSIYRLEEPGVSIRRMKLGQAKGLLEIERR